MNTDPPPTWRAVHQVMGMPISIALRGLHAGTPAGEDAWLAVLDDLDHVDRMFSTYRPDSVVSRIDRGELDVARAPLEVQEVLALGEAAKLASSGAFDVWRRDGLDGRRRFDPNGVVKGWAIERATAHLRRLDDTDFCLSGGGDLVALVTDPDRPEWQVGIENPAAPDTLLARIPMREGAVATSSPAHRGTHIVDARTGAAPARIAQVTVIAQELCAADIDATAAFALGPDALAWLRERSGRSGLVVWSDGSTATFTGDSRARAAEGDQVGCSSE